MISVTRHSFTRRSLVGSWFSVTLHAVLLVALSQTMRTKSPAPNTMHLLAVTPIQVMLLRKPIIPSSFLATIKVTTGKRSQMAVGVLPPELTVLQDMTKSMDAGTTAEPVAVLTSVALANENFKRIETVPEHDRSSAAEDKTPLVPMQSARPDYAYNPVPEYPMLLREHGVGGTVWLRVWVDSEGRPANVKVAKGSGYRMLDEAALRVVAQWRFIPAQKGEQKLASWVEFPIRFTLNG